MKSALVLLIVTAVLQLRPADTFLILRSDGPSASEFRRGARLVPTQRIHLRAGDRISVLGPHGTRLFRGPGDFRVSDPPRIGPAVGTARVRETVAATRFPGGPLVYRLAGGGDVDLSEDVGSDCSGFVAVGPSLELRHHGQGDRFTLYVRQDGQTDGVRPVLLVNDPAGRWRCSYPGDPDARVIFDGPASGIYDIWLGWSRPGEPRPARLYLEE